MTDVTEVLWNEHLQRLGEQIRTQRQLNRLSQRQLARLADMSDTYMSQLERGLHEPSIRVLRALAESLGLPPDTFIMQAAGLTPDPAEPSTEDAIQRDERFTNEQKKALLAVVRSYVADNADG
jgi:transcriptional regulator with XRE-family HTH domain